MTKKLLETMEDKFEKMDADKKIERHIKALSGEILEKPVIVRSEAVEGFSPYSMQETHDDIEKMFYNQMLGAFGSARQKNDGIPMLRADYGTGTLPSLFGAKSIIVNNNMPWTEHLSLDEIKKILSKGEISLENGFGAKVIETYEFYKNALSKYPNLKEKVKLYHPDLQGPFDVAHILWGSDIYMAIYDEPDMVKELMQLVTDTYIKFLDKVKTVIDDEIEVDGKIYNYHWNSLFPGSVTVRDDSSVNLSQDCYTEFVLPYNEKIFNYYKTATMHFCGQANQWTKNLLECECLKGWNLGHMSKLEFGEAFLDKWYSICRENDVSIAMYYLSSEELKTFDFSKYKNITYLNS